jgi:hypothetical protein
MARDRSRHRGEAAVSFGREIRLVIRTGDLVRLASIALALAVTPTPQQIASIPIFADPKGRPHPGWLTFGLSGEYAYPDGGVVIDTKTKRVVARIPTSEKLIEIDFENGRAVRAGHR